MKTGRKIVGKDFKEDFEEKIDLRAQTDPDDGVSAPPDEDPFLGRLIAQRILVMERLGAGGMSTVYKANHQLLDRIVALKIVQPGNANSQAIRRFQQEAKAATALNHPNIAAVREFGVDENGNPYLIMDFVDGTPLERELKTHGKLPADRIASLMYKVCEGLEHAHSAGIVHRDLKPANIIITKSEAGEESARIVDFGIAKVLKEENATNLTKTGDIFGTPNYMSPEQCMGQKAIDQRTDIYSLGCMMFECLEGKPPFVGESSFETLLKHVNEIPKFSEMKTNANLKKIALRCMEKEPSKRYQTIAAVKEDLLSAGAGKSIKYSRTRTAAETKRLLSFGVLSSIIGIGLVIMMFVAPPIFKMMKPWNQIGLEAAQQAALGPSNYGLAKSKYKQAIKTAIDGRADNTDLRDLYAGLARVNTQENDADAAVMNFTRALQYNGEGAQNFEAGSYYDWMCDALVQAKRFDEAVESGEKAVAIKKRALGPNHKFTLYALLHLGQAYRGNKMIKKAEEIDREAIKVAEGLFPQQDSTTLADTYEQYGNLLRLTNRPQEALPWYEKALPVSIKARGEEDKRTKQILDRIAELKKEISKKK